MAEQNIAGVSVSITGDYSQLEQDFATTQQIAAESGQKVAESFNAGVQPAADLDAKYQELFASGMSLAEAQAAIGQTASEAGAATTQAAEGTEKLATAAHGASEGLHEAAGGAHELAGELMQLAGLAITAESIKALGEESILAFGREQQLATSMDLLGAGAAGASEKVEQLKSLSMQLAVPFATMADTARRMASAFGTGDNMNAVLIAAGNAAAATGRNFETVAQAIERVSLTGQLTARQLLTLGVSWQDMATAMGTSIADAQARLAKGGQDAQQDVAAVLAAINAKFGDAAERQAQNTLGVITNVKNQAEFIFGAIGEDLAPIVDGLAGAMKVAASSVVLFIGGVKLGVDGMILSIALAIEGVKGLGAVATQIIGGNLAGAVTEAVTTNQRMEDISKHFSDEMLKDSLKTSGEFEKIWGGASDKIKAAFVPQKSDMGGDASADFKIKQTRDMTDAIALLAAQEHLEIAAHKAAIEETAKFNESMGTSVSTADYLAMKTALATEAIDGMGDADIRSKDKISALESETNKLSNVMGKLGAEIVDAQQAAMDSTPWRQMDEALKSLGLDTDALGEKTRAAKLAAYELLSSSMLSNIDQAREGFRGMSQEVSRLAHDNLPAAIVEQEKLIADMRARGEAQGKINQQEEIGINLMIRQKQEAGGLQAVYGNLLSGVQHGFQGVGQSIASMVMAGKSAGEILTTTLKNIATSAIGSVIQGLVDLGARFLLTAILGKAASTTLASTQIADETAVIYAATFASIMAAIPFPFNLEMAPEIAAGTAAMVGSTAGAMIGIGTADHGGLMPEDMITLVHKGEYISTTNDTARALAGGGASGITINITGPVTGVPSADFVKRVMTEAVRPIRLPLGMKVNF